MAKKGGLRHLWNNLGAGQEQCRRCLLKKVAEKPPTLSHRRSSKIYYERDGVRQSSAGECPGNGLQEDLLDLTRFE